MLYGKHKLSSFQILFRKNPEEFLARIEAKTSKDAAANKTKEFSLPGQAKTKLDASTSTASGTR